MVAFEPLRVDEATALVEESIRDFTNELLRAVDLTDAPFERMRGALRQRLLPEGFPVTSHHFEAILSEGMYVGRVWFGPLDGDDTTVYIYDISVATEHRRHGHARAAIELIIDNAAQSGAARVGLSVAQANSGAIVLYESLGFVTRHSDDNHREMWTVVDRSRASRPRCRA